MFPVEPHPAYVSITLVRIRSHQPKVLPESTVHDEVELDGPHSTQLPCFVKRTFVLFYPFLQVDSLNYSSTLKPFKLHVANIYLHNRCSEHASVPGSTKSSFVKGCYVLIAITASQQYDEVEFHVIEITTSAVCWLLES